MSSRNQTNTIDKPLRSSVNVGGAIGFAAAVVTILCGGIQVYDRSKAAKARPVDLGSNAAEYEKAKQLFYEKKTSAAIIEVQKVVQSDPKDKNALKLLAACYGVQNNLEACATEYREAVKLDHHDDEALVGLGTSLEAIGDKVGAKDAYERVIGDPDAAISRREYARARLETL